ncbi:MAG: hypothetical protein ACK56F_01525, partial [bacterium]
PSNSNKVCSSDSIPLLNWNFENERFRGDYKYMTPSGWFSHRGEWPETNHHPGGGTVVIQSNSSAWGNRGNLPREYFYYCGLQGADTRLWKTANISPFPSARRVVFAVLARNRPNRPNGM